jgi:hypothetical protein
MRLMERSETRLPHVIPLFRQFKTDMLQKFTGAFEHGHISADQRARATKILDEKLQENPLALTAWALNPVNASLITGDERKVVSKWLTTHANLYGTTPSSLRTTFCLYVMKDPQSLFADKSDVWDHTPTPVRFWRMVQHDDPLCALAVVGEQLCGFLAHAADLERMHSMLAWLQNKYRNALQPHTLIALARVNRCMYQDRLEAAKRLAEKAARDSLAAQRAAEVYRNGVDLDEAYSSSSSSSSEEAEEEEEEVEESSEV